MKPAKTESGSKKLAADRGGAGGGFAQQPATHRYPWWKKAVFTLVAACLFFGIAELALVYVFWMSDTPDGADRPTDDSQTDATSDYPTNPEEYIKIAVFGGSASEGAYAWRALDKILEHDLRLRFPDQNIFVKNYAQSGYPFHRHQAEHVKTLIEKYDFFLIYCGNNEAENWFDESGYWRHPEYKSAKELVFQRPLEADHPLLQPIRRALADNSRIYYLFKMAKDRLITVKQSPTKNRVFDYEEFEEADAVPPIEKNRIVSNFATDLSEICQLAEQHNKQVLISISATYETWPPCFSYFRPDITTTEKQQWQKLYKKGLAAYEAREYQKAILSFQEAREVDPTAAILNFRLGMSYVQRGEAVVGRRFLRQAIDQDGYYSRSITPLHQKAQKLSKKFKHLHYVDTVTAFHAVLEGDISDDELFTDICHPSFLGQVIIGHLFVNKLLELHPFQAWMPDPGRKIRGTDWKALADYYFEQLQVTADIQAQQALQHIHWYFDMAHWTAYRTLCYTAIDKLIDEFERCHDGTTWARAITELTRSRLAVARKDYPDAVRLINQALRISDEALKAELNAPTWSGFVNFEFQAAGIEFSAEQGAYVLRARTNP